MAKHKMMERRLSIGMGTIEGPIPQVIETLQGLVEQHGPSARLEIDYGYEGSDELILVFQELETDDEYNQRIKASRALKAKRKALREQEEQTERALYLKLRAKFETEDEA